MMASLGRVLTVAHNSLLEALRQKVLLLVLLFALVCLSSANLFTSFAFEDQLKFVKDFSFGAMSVFGFLLAVLGAAQMVQAEIDNRTIYTVLSKPIRRAELIWGKYLGLASLLLLSLLLMTGVFFVVLQIKEADLVTAESAAVDNPQSPSLRSDLQVLHHQAQDPNMVKAWLLLVAKLLLAAGLATLISTISTSMVFTVSTTLLLYVIGHLEAVAREGWFLNGDLPLWWQRVVGGILALLIPDFGAFGVMDDLLAGNVITWHYTLSLLTYTTIYVGIILVVSQLIFEHREF